MTGPNWAPRGGATNRTHCRRDALNHVLDASGHHFVDGLGASRIVDGIHTVPYRGIDLQSAKVRAGADTARSPIHFFFVRFDIRGELVKVEDRQIGAYRQNLRRIGDGRNGRHHQFHRLDRKALRVRTDRRKSQSEQKSALTLNLPAIALDRVHIVSPMISLRRFMSLYKWRNSRG